MNEEEREEENLTPDEEEEVEEEVEEDSMSGEEAHRYEEFEELNGKLDRALTALDSIIAALNEVQGVAIESGAIVTDDTDPVEIEVETLDEDMDNWKWDED